MHQNITNSPKSSCKVPVDEVFRQIFLKILKHLIRVLEADLFHADRPT
jgi:hypothetical protein